MRVQLLACLLVGLLAGACRQPAAPPSRGAEDPRRVLRVCADPNNLPFSNEREEGFENRIAELLARELDADLRYVWRPQRRGFIREGINAGACDVVIGIASRVDMALTSRPYYRSTYAVVQAAGTRAISSLDDPALAKLRIGVQIVGDDYHNTPPVHALARRGLARNLVGFTVYGDYATDSPAADVVRAVARGDVDIAIAWGPFAGYHARNSAQPLQVTPLAAADVDLPMAFDISLAVKRDHKVLLEQLEDILARERAAIESILDDHAVPRA